MKHPLINNAEWALPCKGVTSGNSHYKLSTVNKTGSRVNLSNRLCAQMEYGRLILGIESSCDETSAAVVAEGRAVLSNGIIVFVTIFKNPQKS